MSHTVVVCVGKRERGIGMRTVLSKAGYRVVMAFSLYEALKLAEQEMPHLVVSDAMFEDGNAGTLYDRLMQHEILKKTPVLVCATRNTREEVAIVGGRRFAGHVLGAFDPKTLLAKVRDVMRAYSFVSPYFLPAETMGVSPELTIAVEARIVGRLGGHLVARSRIELDAAASLTCIPSGEGMEPVVLCMPYNLREGDEIFQLFPIHRSVGGGRRWVMGLPEIKLDAEPDRRTRVLFYEPNESRYLGFREILQGYGVDLIHAKSLGAATLLLKRQPEAFSVVYLHDLPNDASAVEWRQVYGKLPAARRPSLLVATSTLTAPSSAVVRYIKRPFGMGVFVEALQSTLIRARDLAQAVDKSAAHVGAGIVARYEVPARLVGLDETGGIIELRLPLLQGSRVSIQHDVLSKAWEGHTTVSVAGAALQAAIPGSWHARFEAIAAGTSKIKYWEKLSKLLSLEQAS